MISIYRRLSKKVGLLSIYAVFQDAYLGHSIGLEKT